MVRKIVLYWKETLRGNPQISYQRCCWLSACNALADAEEPCGSFFGLHHFLHLGTRYCVTFPVPPPASALRSKSPKGCLLLFHVQSALAGLMRKIVFKPYTNDTVQTPGDFKGLKIISTHVTSLL